MINSEDNDFEDNVSSTRVTKVEVNKVNEGIKKIIFPSTATGCKASFLNEPGNFNPTHAWHEYGTKNIMI